jgi:O-methyltransferase
MGYGLSRLSFPGKVDRLALVQKIRAERSMLVTPTEGWTIASMIEAVRLVPGDLAEVGTYQGASAGLIASCAPNKSVHVFDTFEGLPTPSGSDGQDSWAYEGNFDVAFEEVRRYLNRWPNIHIYRGLFPASAAGLEELRFSFVHLDVDLYEGTLGSLQWFYPRLNTGAILVTHDYNFCPGVKKAFDEFFADKNDTLIELPTNQALFVKR